MKSMVDYCVNNKKISEFLNSDSVKSKFIKVTYVLGFSSLVFSVYSFYLLILTGNFYYGISAMVGYMLMFMIIDRNVYYKRVESFVDLVKEQKLPIRYDSHTSLVYDKSFIIDKYEDYEEITVEDESLDEEVVVMRNYIDT